MEEDSTSTVPMLPTHCTFIGTTVDGTVTEARNSTKRQRTTEKVSEDLWNRQIQDYGLVCPERAKNLVWSYFKKCGSKNLTRGHDNLKLQQQALCTICLADQDRRCHSTVLLLISGKFTSMLSQNVRMPRQVSERKASRIIEESGCGKPKFVPAGRRSDCKTCEV